MAPASLLPRFVHHIPRTSKLPAGARTDDSYKYPLRTASGGSCASFPPAYLAASTADPDGTLKGNGGANGNKKKLDGYRGHMEALGKLGEASAQSRLFPTPPKKIMKAVGQAIQVRALSPHAPIHHDKLRENCCRLSFCLLSHLQP